MHNSTLEKEVKFYITDLAALKDRLLAIGAHQTQPRTRELNYRFDTPDGQLAHSGRALRLRQDMHTLLTFKGPSSLESGVRVRPEYEAVVDDFNATRSILEGLGYVLTVSYEKWRAVYQYNGLEITLDELPYGNFTEIEGADTAAIQTTARVLSLDWAARIQESYLELFAHLKKTRGLTMNDLTYNAFNGVAVTWLDLGVRPADLPAFL
jgi:adenylate cyclase class 2